jgi:hypothetical protein
MSGSTCNAGPGAETSEALAVYPRTEAARAAAGANKTDPRVKFTIGLEVVAKPASRQLATAAS